MPRDLEDQITAIRHFNRFYTRHVGALNEGLLDSPYSLTEMRILYELAHHAPLTAGELSDRLRLDPGYVSRLLAAFNDAGLLDKTPAKEDKRRRELRLSAAGMLAFAPYDRASREETAAVLAPLSDGDRDRLVDAMTTIEEILSGARRQQAAIVLRDPRPGDLGYIVHRQAVLYHRDHGFDQRFEGLVADITGKFVANFDPNNERCWIADRGGEIVGSVFVVKASDAVAKLRMLYVEPSARGCGLGGKLVEECIHFARAKGYRQLALWTNDVLVPARRIYEKAGFRLVGEEPHDSLGPPLVGQNWILDL